MCISCLIPQKARSPTSDMELTVKYEILTITDGRRICLEGCGVRQPLLS